MATEPDHPSLVRSGVAGLLAAALALAVGELVAGISGRLAAPVISVGNAVSCRATNITNPTRLINEAIRSAKEITLEEPRFG